MYIIILILLNIIIYSSQQQIRFDYILGAGEEQCLYEYFPEKTFVIYSVRTYTNKIMIELKNSSGYVMYSKKDSDFNEGFTTTKSDYLELCTYNKGKTNATFEFELKYGVGANDYSSVVKSKDLKPIEIEMKKIVDKKGRLEHYNRFSQNNDKLFESSLDSMSQKIVFYSISLIIFMIVVGLSETIYLKKFMEKRKII